MGVSKNNLYCHWYKIEQINWPLSLYRVWVGHETTWATPSLLIMPLTGTVPQELYQGDRTTMPPLGTGVRDGQGWGEMFHGLREVKKINERKVGGALPLFTAPPLCAESTEQKGGTQPHGCNSVCSLRGPHGHRSGAADRAGCLGSAGGTPPAAAGL